MRNHSTTGHLPGITTGAERATTTPTNRELRVWRAHFETMPPRHTRQAQTRLCVIHGKPRSFKTAAARREENNLLALLLSAKPDGWKPIDGPVVVSITMTWPYRKSEKRRIVKAGRKVPLASRSVGDLDNQALKTPLDALVAAQIIRDDALVAEVHVARYWGPRAHWSIEIRELDAEGGAE